MLWPPRICKKRVWLGSSLYITVPDISCTPPIAFLIWSPKFFVRSTHHKPHYAISVSLISSLSRTSSSACSWNPSEYVIPLTLWHQISHTNQEGKIIVPHILMFKSSDRRRIDKLWTETCRYATLSCSQIFELYHTFSGSFYKLHLYCDSTRYGCKITNDTLCNDNDYRSFNEFRWAWTYTSTILATRLCVRSCYPCVRHDLWVRHCTVDKRRTSDILEVWVCAINGEVFVCVAVLIVR